MKLVFLDTETTGLTDYDRLCQLAYKHGDEVLNELYLPPVDINIEAMAVHKITQDMVKDKPAFKDSERYDEIKKLLQSKKTVMICHNVPYDEKMLHREDIKPAVTLCTLKVARHLFKDDSKIKKFNLQYLRINLDIDVEGATAHDAFGDILILERLFEKLVEVAGEKSAAWCEAKGLPPMTRNQIIERMLEISNGPAKAVDAMPFQKHKGKKIADVVKEDRQYCQWILREKIGGDNMADLHAQLKQLLNAT